MLSSTANLDSDRYINPAKDALSSSGAQIIPSTTSSIFDQSFSRDFSLDSLDLQNLPSLMSPDPLPKNYPEDSVFEDEDEDMDEYEIFSPLGNQNRNRHRNVSYQPDQSMERAVHLLNLQQLFPDKQQQLYTHHSHGAGEDKPMTPLQILRPNHPMVLQRTLSMTSLDSLYYHQQQQQISQQSSTLSHQQHFPLSLSHTPLYSTPTFTTAPPLQQQQQQQQQMHFQTQQASSHQQSHFYSPITPITNYNQAGLQRDEHLGVLNRYLSTLPSQSRPLPENTIPTANQDMDLMMLSSMTLSSSSSVEVNTLNSMQSSFVQVQSPSLSWASTSNLTSRETSPSLSPELLQQSMTAAANEMMFPLISSSTNMAIADTNSISAPPSVIASPSAPSSPSSAPTAKRRRHRVRPPTVKKPKKVKPTSYACAEPGCDKIFSRAYNLTSHMKTHSSDRPFHCGICPLAFARRHDRERHVRLHTGDKPYNCGVCRAGFMRNDALHRHQKLCGAAGSIFSMMSTGYFEEQQQQQMLQQQQMHSRGQGENAQGGSNEETAGSSLEYFY